MTREWTICWGRWVYHEFQKLLEWLLQKKEVSDKYTKDPLDLLLSLCQLWNGTHVKEKSVEKKARRPKDKARREKITPKGDEVDVSNDVEDEEGKGKYVLKKRVKRKKEAKVEEEEEEEDVEPLMRKNKFKVSLVKMTKEKGKEKETKN